MFQLQGLVEQVEKANMWVASLVRMCYVREGNVCCFNWVTRFFKTLALLMVMHGVP